MGDEVGFPRGAGYSWGTNHPDVWRERFYPVPGTMVQENPWGGSEGRAR